MSGWTPCLFLRLDYWKNPRKQVEEHDSLHSDSILVPALKGFYPDLLFGTLLFPIAFFVKASLELVMPCFCFTPLLKEVKFFFVFYSLIFDESVDVDEMFLLVKFLTSQLTL